jgi:sphinganine-1-phosphate aldolase
MYRNKELMHCQYFVSPGWMGGIYATSTFAGSRPGVLVASCWTTLVHFGRAGYAESTRKIIHSARIVKEG